MSRYTWLIEAGHGGYVNGKNYTDPKWGKFFHHPGFTAYEGETNRKIAKMLMVLLEENDFSYQQIHHGFLDIGLTAVTNKVNQLHTELGECVFLSIHSNAISSLTKDTIPPSPKGYGFEVWTSIGDTPADPMAEVLAMELKERFKDQPQWPVRIDKTDGDMDKEANYHILKHTTCPAILPELLFFDELKQAQYLYSEQGQRKLADTIFNAIKKIELL